MDKIKDPTPPPANPKKAYHAPVLSEYGDVRQLTSGGGGGNNDTGGGMTKMCWIAEALYGCDTPRVLLVRGWLTRCYVQRIWWALAIVPLYVNFGERVAAAVRVSPRLARVFRPVFDHAVLRGFRAYCSKAVLHSNIL